MARSTSYGESRDQSRAPLAADECVFRACTRQGEHTPFLQHTRDFGAPRKPFRRPNELTDRTPRTGPRTLRLTRDAASRLPPGDHWLAFKSSISSCEARGSGVDYSLKDGEVQDLCDNPAAVAAVTKQASAQISSAKPKGNLLTLLLVIDAATAR